MPKKTMEMYTVHLSNLRIALNFYRGKKIVPVNLCVGFLFSSRIYHFAGQVLDPLLNEAVGFSGYIVLDCQS